MTSNTVALGFPGPGQIKAHGRWIQRCRVESFHHAAGNLQVSPVVCPKNLRENMWKPQSMGESMVESMVESSLNPRCFFFKELKLWADKNWEKPAGILWFIVEDLTH